MDVQSDEVTRGVRQRIGTIVGSRGPVPAAVWTAPDHRATHLVLIGHGGNGSKLEPYVVALAQALVRDRRTAALAIDGPVHGDRSLHPAGPSTLDGLEFAKSWANDEYGTDGMVRDWRDALDDALTLDDIAPSAAVGYWGLSMGTVFGLPLVASEPRITAAVLGLMGTTGPSRERLAHDAPGVTVPILFLVQWDDQLIPRDESLALYSLLGARDKTLLATPGFHAEVTRETFRRTQEFLTDRLSGPGDTAGALRVEG